jgi:hypothetical protein
MAVWRTFLSFKARQTAIIISSGLLHLTQEVQILKKCSPNCQYYLQRAVTPDWMGSFAL